MRFYLWQIGYFALLALAATWTLILWIKADL